MIFTVLHNLQIQGMVGYMGPDTEPAFHVDVDPDHDTEDKQPN